VATAQVAADFFRAFATDRIFMLWVRGLVQQGGIPAAETVPLDAAPRRYHAPAFGGPIYAPQQLVPPSGGWRPTYPPQQPLPSP
jgi:hypothetical protein